MRLVLYTPIASPHQLPLANEIRRQHPELEFYYVYTHMLPPDAVKRGWSWTGTECWIVNAKVRAELAKDLIEQCDVLLSGIRDVGLFGRRSKAGKKTLYMSERWFKPIPVGERLKSLTGFTVWDWVRLPGWVRMVVPGYWKMARRVVKLANCDPNFRCLAIGPWAAKDMRLIGVRSDKIVPWAYFVESSQHPKGCVHSTPAHYTSQHPLRILWLGRMLQLKRVDTVIKAVKRLNANGLSDTIALTLLGQGDEEVHLRELAKDSDNIVFRPGVPIDEVRQVMREHDVLVFSSNGEDGWGAVVNEALEEGLTVLGTRETGASATMLPVEQLFCAGDDSALADLIEYCLEGKLRPVGIGEWSVANGAAKVVAMCNE